MSNLTHADLETALKPWHRFHIYQFHLYLGMNFLNSVVLLCYAVYSISISIVISLSLQYQYIDFYYPVQP